MHQVHSVRGQQNQFRRLVVTVKGIDNPHALHTSRFFNALHLFDRSLTLAHHIPLRIFILQPFREKTKTKFLMIYTSHLYQCRAAGSPMELFLEQRERATTAG